MSAPNEPHGSKSTGPATPLDRSGITQQLAAMNLNTGQQVAKTKRKAAENAASKLREENHTKWQEAAVNLAPYQTPVALTPSIKHRVNCFEIKSYNKDGQTPQLVYRYLIKLGLVNDKEPSKRELRRYLIETMLDQNPLPQESNGHAITILRSYPTSHFIPITRISQEHRTVWSTRVQQAQTMILEESKFTAKSVMKECNAYSPGEDLKALNIISWAQINSSNWRAGQIGNRFFLPDDKVTKVDGFVRGKYVYELKTGFFSSVRPGDGKLLLNVNTATSAFFPETILQEWIQSRWKNATVPPPGGKHELIGLCVVFVGDERKRRRKIRQVSDLTVATMIQKLDNDGKSRDQLPHCPVGQRDHVACINLRAIDDPDWYPADKLQIARWSVVRHKLAKDYTEYMLSAAKIAPDAARSLILEKALSSLLATRQPSWYQNFGLTVESDFLSLNLRTLAVPTLSFNGVNVRVTDTASWNLRLIRRGNKCEFGKTGSPFRLYVINILDQSDRGACTSIEVEKFAGVFVEGTQHYGIKIPKNCPAEIANVSIVKDGNASIRRNDFNKALDKPWHNWKQPGVVIVILPSKNSQTYSDVKSWGECLRGVLTICVTPKLVRATQTERMSDGIIGNWSLKLNVKTKGTNHRLPLRYLERKTMIVGADVTHPGRGIDPTCPSLAAVVASVDDIQMQYFGSARLQDNNAEGMMLERFKKWFSTNGKTLPDHILFYRDGVSESQYGMVKLEELKQIKEAIKEAISGARAHLANTGHLKNVPEDKKISVTMLVVGKRHHTRFYLNTPSTDNPKAGLIADHTVIAPNFFNFYLQSHYASKMGTLKPGHYVVIENESKYTADKLQRITNELCFASARATKGLSVCAPARYADNLCDRLRCYMRPVYDGQLPDMKNSKITTYHDNLLIWVGNSDPHKNNPWHKNLDDVMFYI